MEKTINNVHLKNLIMKKILIFKEFAVRYMQINLLILCGGLIFSSNSLFAQNYPSGVLPISDSEYATYPRPNWDTLNKYANTGAIIPQIASDGSSGNIVMLQTPPVQGQGWINSCLGWSFGYCALSILNYSKYCNWSKAERSPSYIYNQIKVTSDCGSGAYLSSVLNLVTTQGVCSWNLMPYNYINCDTLPNAIQKADALNNKAIGWYAITRTDINSIKNALNIGLPVVITTHSDSSFWTMWYSGVGIFSVDVYTPKPGGHATCIVGYDDNKNMVKVQNSVGITGGDTAHGNAGFYWIPYSSIQNGILLGAYVLYGTTVNVTGSITHPSNSSGWVIKNATVAAGVTTDINGNYSRSLSSTPSSYSITPSKLTGSGVDGVNGTDIAQIQSLILQKANTFSTIPYKYIAADVNGDGLINNDDITLIKNMILRKITNYPSTAYGN